MLCFSKRSGEALSKKKNNGDKHIINSMVLKQVYEPKDKILKTKIPGSGKSGILNVY
ncbi:hypothetical protein RCH19_002649 [Flavobacterium sp. PL12]